MKNATITVRPMSAHTGAEITGLDLRQPLAEQTYLEVRQAFNQWGVVFFRDQDLTPAQQLTFGRRFGKVQAERTTMQSIDGHEEIKEIVREPDHERNIGGFWHMDKCFLADPDFASILYARELPPVGGDTMFAHLGAAYDALSPGLQATLETLSTVFVKSHSFGVAGALASGGVAGASAPGVTPEMREKFAGIEATHPMVAHHPETGRKVLYFGPVYSDRFDGWTRDESLALMKTLTTVMTRPEHTCRFRWEEGSLAMWDNRAVMHYALDDYPGQRRVMHRLTVEGPWLTPCTAAA